MAAKKEKPRTASELMHEMRTKGSEQVMPNTDRTIRLKSIDAPALLRKGKMPDLLTPLVIKLVYTEVPDREIREFLSAQKSKVEDALAMADALDFVAAESIMDGTKVEDLTMAEKRWIFRLAMGPAELLVNFRNEEELDVGIVGEVEDVSQIT
jgi:hypothetical protein